MIDWAQIPIGHKYRLGTNTDWARFLKYVPNRHLCPIDPSSKMIDWAQIPIEHKGRLGTCFKKCAQSAFVPNREMCPVGICAQSMPIEFLRINKIIMKQQPRVDYQIDHFQLKDINW